MRTFYMSLWDQYGVEAHFPGYARQMATFDHGKGVVFNAHTVSWPVQGATMQTFTRAKIHDAMWGEPLFELALTDPVSGFCAGDVINFAAHSVTITMDAGMSKVLMRSASLEISTFNDFMEKNPDATPEQIWEAAFIAGHQTAHTLLTGEPQ